VVEHRKLMADFSVLCQLFNAYAFKTWCGRARWLRQLLMLGLIGPVSLLGLLLARVMPATPDLYLDQLVVASRR
jgi:hypothetical protein